ncbi:hypothetical protein NE237_029100 [Protea cynaroides]|uniref:FAD-binding domain-containing protein n=1 Tax=Protea cynaroides TaxID=273540 RepID=A0A9Q0GTA5_9MAGN|nr:hypothetical protein NE237_029100 [Protea cynaroides]
MMMESHREYTIGLRNRGLREYTFLLCRSYALTLFPNAWFALQALGVAHKLTSIDFPIQKAYVTNVANGATKEVSYMGINGTSNGPIAVHRSALLETLAGELAPGTIRFSSKLTSIRTITIDDEVSSSIAILSLDDGTIIKAKVLIGCDGVHSLVARWLGLMAPEEIYQFIDEGKRAGFVPLTDKELYWFLTYNSSLKVVAKGFNGDLAKDFPSVLLEVVQHADLATVTWAQLMFRYPWDLIFSQGCKGNITVVGDAMHPMTPDLGQGGCLALENAVILGRHVAKSLLLNPNSHEWLVAVDAAKAIEGYVKERRWRAVGLITRSYFSSLVQQGGSGSFMNFLRDTIFYGFLFHRFFNVQYDYGKLPNVTLFSEFDVQTKID